ncbi:MAG: HAD family hydrolase [Clostridium sp.]
MKKIILFDLDGTLTDPMVGITKSVSHALKAYGIIEEDLEKLCPFIGPPLTDSFKEFYGFSEEDAKAAIPIFHEYFVGRGMYENKVYEGIEEMLGSLRDAGYTLAVATSKPEPFAIEILRHFSLLSYFDLVGGADMEEVRVKKGDVITYTLERLEMINGPLDTLKASGNIIMVGDRKHDICGAKEAGLPSIGVLYGYGSRAELTEAGADVIAATVKDLQEILLQD